MKPNSYDIEVCIVSNTDFEMELTMYSTSKFFNKLFKRARRTMAKKKGIDIDSSKIDEIKEFQAPEIYYPAIKNFLKPLIRKENIAFRQNKMVMLSYNVKKAIYKKKGDIWVINIILGGQYGNA